MAVDAPGAEWHEAPALGGLTLWRVFWRSLFLQAAWNPKGMQNLGFAYALYPALKRLYPEPRALQQAVDRHLSFFNSHPYAAATVVGGAVHHEERIARGEELPESVTQFKQALMGPMAALGDGFFWLSLRPACGALAVLLALAIGGWSALAFLFGYNAVALGLRGWFFVQGYRRGDEVIAKVAAAGLPRKGERLRVLAAVCAGAVVGVVALPTRLHLSFGPLSQALEIRALLGAAGLLGCGVAFALIRKGLSPYVLVYGAAALAVVLGLIL